MTVLRGLTCACGSADLISVEPGEDGEQIDLLGTPVALKAGRSDRAWCGNCAPWTRWLQQTLPTTDQGATAPVASPEPAASGPSVAMCGTEHVRLAIGSPTTRQEILMSQVFRVTAEIPLADGILAQAKTLASLEHPIEELKKAIEHAGGKLEHAVVTPRPRQAKASDQAPATEAEAG